VKPAVILLTYNTAPVSDPHPLWDLRRRNLVRARKRLRAGDSDGLHDVRVALRRVAATASALGRRKLERRAKKIVRSLSSDRQLEVDLALLARVGKLGLLSADGVTALEARWKSLSGSTESPGQRLERDDRLRPLLRKLRWLAARPQADALERLLKERSQAEVALAEAPEKSDDDTLHRFRLRVKRARYLAEDLAACGGIGFELLASREKGAQDVLGRWNDLHLFLERIDRERKAGELRGAVRLAAELEELASALGVPLAALRGDAMEIARRLSSSFSLAARSA
jgi:CHAD domain-containing protein